MNNKVIDIRRIVLRKDFSVANETKSNNNNLGWGVWGHYDTLEVKSVCQDDYVLPPLQIMGEDARVLSASLKGEEKMHAQYAILYEEKSKIDSFWKSQEEFPLIVVSVIHAKHMAAKRIHPKELLSRIQDCIGRSVDKTRSVKHICYSSLDCCDIIIFWFCEAYNDVMSAIEKMCYEEEGSVQDVFSIQGYKKMNREKLQEYSCLEKQIPFVEFILRGSKLRRVQSFASYLKQELNGFADNVYLLPGQDDVSVLARNIKTNTLISIVEDNGILSPRNLAMHRLFCHTSLGFEFGHHAIEASSHDSQIEVNDRIQLSVALFSRFKKELEILEIEETVEHRPWYPALCELFNQLCNMEASSTAHDIFTQEIYCQSCLVECFIYQLKSNREEFCDGRYDELIQEYLHGWSQLAFHAMHSEWQLTQSFDSNRLYIYPAKLSLFYTAYMHSITKSLTALDFPVDTQKQCTFFLTPKLATDPRFKSTFENRERHTMLVLGEIPAKLLFYPVDLLPVLVHEAAHYVGSKIRCRNARLRCIMLSAAKAYLDKIAMGIPGYSGLSSEERSKVMLSLQGTVDENIQRAIARYGNDRPKLEEVFSIVTQMLYDIQKDEKSELEIKFAIFSNVSDEKIEQAESKAGKINSDCSNENDMETWICRICQDFEVMYRESFADICMVLLLRMTRIEYMRCLVNMLKANEYQMSKEFEKLPGFERCIAVLKIISECQDEIELAGMLKKDIESIGESEGMLRKWIQEVINKLTVEKARRVHYESSEYLHRYLRSCKLKIDQLPDSTHHMDIFKAFSLNKERSEFDEIYQKCYNMIIEYVDDTRKIMYTKYKFYNRMQ